MLLQWLYDEYSPHYEQFLVPILNQLRIILGS